MSGAGSVDLHASIVRLQETPCCDCAEFAAQDADFPCRHLAFIFVQVLVPLNLNAIVHCATRRLKRVRTAHGSNCSCYRGDTTQVLGLDFRAEHSPVFQRKLLESELLGFLAAAAAAEG
jgi:hypothetical protein